MTSHPSDGLGRQHLAARGTLLWKFSCWVLASALLTSCANSPRPSARRQLRLDTETVSRVRHNEPRWKEYGDNSAYAGSNHGKIYKEALKGEPLMISPQGG